MKQGVVVDASVAVGWVHPGQATPETEALLQAVEDGVTIDVPALWPLEVANVLLVLVRRGKLTGTDRAQALRWLRDLPVRVDHEASALAFSRLSELAAEHGLSAYDAAYLELALRLGIPLGCKDGPLRSAAENAGVELFA